MKRLLPSIFTLIVDSRPIFVFEAANLREAYELCREKWLIDELSERSTDGAPLLNERSKLRARVAYEDEAMLYARAAQVDDEEDGLLLVYLPSAAGVQLH